MSGVLDDYLVDPEGSLLDKTRMQAQVLVPVLRVELESPLGVQVYQQRAAMAMLRQDLP